jgi:proteic killer suppression protein
VIAEHAIKLRDILARLDAAQAVTEMDVPGFRLHRLKGEIEGPLGRDRSGELARSLPL